MLYRTRISPPFTKCASANAAFTLLSVQKVSIRDPLSFLAEETFHDPLSFFAN